jgi:hypothetical protein
MADLWIKHETQWYVWYACSYESQNAMITVTLRIPYFVEGSLWWRFVEDLAACSHV